MEMLLMGLGCGRRSVWSVRQQLRFVAMTSFGSFNLHLRPWDHLQGDPVLLISRDNPLSASELTVNPLPVRCCLLASHEYFQC